MCKYHARPIKPSKWRSGNRTQGCSRCEKVKLNGKLRPHRIKRDLKQAYKAIIVSRSKFYGNSMRGIELFNRSIGYKLISPTGHILGE